MAMLSLCRIKNTFLCRIKNTFLSKSGVTKNDHEANEKRRDSGLDLGGLGEVRRPPSTRIHFAARGGIVHLASGVPGCVL